VTIQGSSQVSAKVFRTPVLNDNRKNRQNRYGEQIIVKHRIPIGKPGGFDSLAHREHLYEYGVRGGTVGTSSRGYIGGTGSAVDHHPEIADVQVPYDTGDARKIN
jgi:hypothetical protein